MEASWRWGVLLIVLTMAIHAAAVVTMAFAGLSLRARLETRSLNLWTRIAIQICVIGVIGLLLAGLKSAGFGQRRICGLTLSTHPQTPCSIPSTQCPREAHQG